MNWNQTGMPAALVSRLGQKREIAEFKAVLNDAQNHVMQAVDTDLMAQKLFESGGRELVEMVRGLTAALANAERELEDANRRYERLSADLKRRGICADETPPKLPSADGSPGKSSKDPPPEETKSSVDGLSEWEEWDRRFKALLA